MTFASRTLFGGLAPLTTQQTTAGVFTETIPAGGYTQLIMEAWGAGAGGGNGDGVNFFVGGGGGSGAKAINTAAINIAGQAGNTIKGTIGAKGSNVPTNGGATSINLTGTATGLNIITVNGGSFGADGTSGGAGAPGAGGTLPAGTNWTGTVGNTSGGRPGAAGVAGVNGGPFGAGGTGGPIAGGPGVAGSDGGMIFKYS